VLTRLTQPEKLGLCTRSFIICLHRSCQVFVLPKKA